MPPEQASLAVAATLRYLTAHMPSPVAGALHAALGVAGPPDTCPGQSPDEPHDPDTQA
ncbi:hypothetical protein WKR98_03210 [Pigmentiphaga sp. YJ18]|uniref:hypothetical protein n=1 Tax=Pigmentiphaga sp. YJ18 TaxID=3134907 RepID=UPI0031106FEC